MNDDLPNDLAKPRPDHHIAANLFVGGGLLIILGGVIAYALMSAGVQ